MGRGSLHRTIVKHRRRRLRRYSGKWTSIMTGGSPGRSSSRPAQLTTTWSSCCHQTYSYELYPPIIAAWFELILVWCVDVSVCTQYMYHCIPPPVGENDNLFEKIPLSLSYSIWIYMNFQFLIWKQV